MRQTVFLDTSYLIALIRKKDSRNPDALAAASIFTGRFVTTDLVLVELANSLSLPPNRAVVISAIERIRTEEETFDRKWNARKDSRSAEEIIEDIYSHRSGFGGRCVEV